jgi:hypothetical protein
VLASLRFAWLPIDDMRHAEADRSNFLQPALNGSIEPDDGQIRDER